MKFISEKETPLPTNYSDDGLTLSSVFTVHRRESSKDEWDSTLFIRKDLVRLEKSVTEEFWKKPNKTTLYVRGPPGSGKTCFFYLWARLRSLKDKKSVLIIQFRENKSSYIWIREADGSFWRTEDGIEQDALRNGVDEILEERKKRGMPFGLCIHDGVLQGKQICTSMLSKLNTAVDNGLIEKVAHITSLAFSLSTGGQRLDQGGSIVRLSLDSWTDLDYGEAVACQEFIDRMAEGLLDGDLAYLSNAVDAAVARPDKSNVEEGMAVDGDEKVSVTDVEDDGEEDDEEEDDVAQLTYADVMGEKFFYAGGSARFMFEYSLSELKGVLDERCRLVPDDEWEYFAQGSVAQGTPSSVNTLMQQFSLIASPVSKYVLFKAYQKCKSKLVSAVRAAAQESNNPALRGWAFELEQIDLIRLLLESAQEIPEYITNNDGLIFSPDSAFTYDEKTLKKERVGGEGREDAFIIWCMKWNQGCYDVAFLQEGTLVTMQFTVSEKHSLKPKFIRKLRAALKSHGLAVDTCLHLGVTESANFKFTVDTAGTGRQRNEGEAPEFTIYAYRSPCLQKKSGTAAFQAALLSPVLEEVSMWELNKSKKSGARKKSKTG